VGRAQTADDVPSRASDVLEPGTCPAARDDGALVSDDEVTIVVVR
jgi:hypothetical protein